MKTSTRMFLGFAAFGLGAGGLYAALTKEYAGLLMLFLFAAANIFLAWLCMAAGDPEEQQRLARERGEGGEHHPMHLPPPSVWPVVIAVGAAMTCWGFLLKPPVIVIGVIVILIGAAGWAGGFESINRDLAGWGEVWRYRQYKNLAEIAEELEKQEKAEGGPATG